MSFLSLKYVCIIEVAPYKMCTLLYIALDCVTSLKSQLFPLVCLLYFDQLPSNCFRFDCLQFHTSLNQMKINISLFILFLQKQFERRHLGIFIPFISLTIL